jgi:hypothetical protein
MIALSDPSPSASPRTGLRSEPLVRAAVPRAPHAPAYVAKLRKAWRVVVPIRGRLNPRMIAREFPTQSAALSWLASEEGQNAVACERSESMQNRGV